MKFLAIDTSGEHLSVIVYNDGDTTSEYVPSCARAHSVLLMEKIQSVLALAALSLSELDYFAVVIGAGSFTGIRIGLSTVKGLAFACGKEVVPITSFDCLAYAENSDKGKLLALVDAGHGNYYVCGYQDGEVVLPPVYCTGEEVRALTAEYTPIASKELISGCLIADPCEGLKNAAMKLQGKSIPAEELVALYLRKSSAEENRA